MSYQNSTNISGSLQIEEDKSEFNVILILLTKLVVSICGYIINAAFLYLSVNWVVRKVLDTFNKEKEDANEWAKTVLANIGVKDVKLNEHELSIAAGLVDTRTLNASWDNIGGLEKTIQEIREAVILPIQKRKLFYASKLVQPPQGVLLYGPPGCGKTMIAKAIAKEAKARFINLEVSTITSKYYGESNKLVSALFSLAHKIKPCIIFIDEIDGFLRSRSVLDHELTLMIKTEFLKMWDGLTSDPDCQVIVMGATNRPQDLDHAIMRRLPAIFHISLPNQAQRADILKLILEKEAADDVDTDHMSRLTDGFCGSDLKELCRAASIFRVRDYSEEESQQETDPESPSDAGDGPPGVLRPISMEDLSNALRRMRGESKVCAASEAAPYFQAGLQSTGRSSLSSGSDQKLMIA